MRYGQHWVFSEIFNHINAFLSKKNKTEVIGWVVIYEVWQDTCVSQSAVNKRHAKSSKPNLLSDLTSVFLAVVGSVSSVLLTRSNYISI